MRLRVLFAVCAAGSMSGCAPNYGTSATEPIGDFFNFPTFNEQRYPSPAASNIPATLPRNLTQIPPETPNLLAMHPHNTPVVIDSSPLGTPPVGQ